MMRSSPVTATLLNIGTECAAMRRNRCTKESLGTPAREYERHTISPRRRTQCLEEAEAHQILEIGPIRSRSAIRLFFINEERSAPSK